MLRTHVYLLCGAGALSLVYIIGISISAKSKVLGGRSSHLPPYKVRQVVDDNTFCPACSSNTLTQTIRRHTLRRACSSLGYYEDTLYASPIPHLKYTMNLRMSVKYQTLFCLIPKVGSSSWVGTMLILDGHLNSTSGMGTRDVVTASKKYLKSFANFKYEARLAMLRNFTTVLFVRNPYTRLLSAFRDRLETYPNRNPGHRRIHNKKIYTMFGNHSKDESPGPSVKSELYNVTFKEFVDYYLSGVNDIHWQVQRKVCPPCGVSYDYIGKAETFAEDYNEVLKLMDAESQVPLIKAAHATHSSDKAVLKEYYDTLTDKQLEKLHKVLERDMILFGYDVPDEINRQG